MFTSNKVLREIILFILISFPIISFGITVPTDYRTIQEAIDALPLADYVQSVTLLPGVYKENISINKNISITSLDPKNRSVVNNTIIDGQGNGSVITVGNSFCNVIINGVTIINGKAEYGAAVQNSGFNKKGFYIYPKLSLTNCIIKNNESIISSDNTYHGVICGFNNSYIGENVIENNKGAAITHCTDLNIRRNIIRNNTALHGQNQYGGVISDISMGLLEYNYYINGNFIYNNYGTGISNCSKVKIVNNTIYGNYSPLIASGILNCSESIINENIIWNNQGYSNNQIIGNSIPTYCCIQNYTDVGTGNISQDPSFADPAGHDFHLLGYSPCIDAGNPDTDTTQGIHRDIDGDTLPSFGGQSLTNDIGADEYVFSSNHVYNVPQDYPTIQGAIDTAVNGDIIIVSPGIYPENIRINKYLKLISINPENKSIVEQTIIDGQNSGSVVTFSDDGLKRQTELSGFTITKGKSINGAALNCSGSKAKIQYNEIKNNTAEYSPGLEASDVSIIFWPAGELKYNSIVQNSGISIISSNQNCVIEANNISDNLLNAIPPTSTSGVNVYGAVIYSGSGIIRNNIINNNTGIAINGGLGTIEGNVLTNNLTSIYAHGNDTLIYSYYGLIMNNIIAFNTGVSLENCSSCEITNNTIVYNSGAYECIVINGTSHGRIKNNILFFNQSRHGVQIINSVIPEYCCIENWTGEGTGNISQDPQLVDAAGGDFRLMETSPCIDTGSGYKNIQQDGFLQFPGNDIFGLTRPYPSIINEFHGDGSFYDIGASEFQSQIITVTPTPTSTPTPTPVIPDVIQEISALNLENVPVFDDINCIVSQALPNDEPFSIMLDIRHANIYNLEGYVWIINNNNYSVSKSISHGKVYWDSKDKRVELTGDVMIKIPESKDTYKIQIKGYRTTNSSLALQIKYEIKLRSPISGKKKYKGEMTTEAALVNSSVNVIADSLSWTQADTAGKKFSSNCTVHFPWGDVNGKAYEERRYETKQGNKYLSRVYTFTMPVPYSGKIKVQTKKAIYDSPEPLIIDKAEIQAKNVKMEYCPPKKNDFTPLFEY